MLAALAVGAAIGWGIGQRRAVPERLPEPLLPPRVMEEALATLTAGAVVLDGRNRVVYANPAAERLRLVRKGALASADLGRMISQLRRGGRAVEGEIETARGPGASAIRVRAALAGRTGHAVLLVDDITMARRLESVRRDFVANVSHELKTPVGALALLAEALHESHGDADAVARFSARMLHESRRLSRLVQELVDLSRLQGADLHATSTPVSVDRVVSEALDRTRLRAEAKAIEVVVGGDESLWVRGDEGQLVTALSNLLDNAVAYSAPDTQIAIGAYRRDENVEIAVRDQGIGIAPADLDRIFERFYRTDPARSRDTGGTGLGLAIVKHIAANHRGSVSVWSAEGTGSTFTLLLPLHVDERIAAT